MRNTAKLGFAVLGVLAVMASGAALFIGSGMYNIGADDHHTKPVLVLIERLRDRSIEMRARTIEVPQLEEPGKIAAGAERYAALCVGCHLAPGVAKSDIRPGLYPHPPSLAQEEVRDSRRSFWTIKHGIKMSAMPAWGKSLDDAAIWDIVAFVRKLPQMSPETYQQLSQGHSGETASALQADAPR
jgi:mono/diheme cytochrome c family protein